MRKFKSGVVSHFVEFSVGTQQRRKALGRVAEGNLKDMRKEASRALASHNVSDRNFAAPHVVEAIINHISGTKGGVAGIYNKALYLPERGARTMGRTPRSAACRTASKPTKS